jgi:general secretion pathway protein L
MKRTQIVTMLASFKSVALVFGAWWVSELVGCIPASVRNTIFCPEKMPVIKLADGKASVHYPKGVSASNSNSATGDKPALVDVQPSDVFCNQFRMPSVEKSKLRQAVLFEIERRSPMPTQNASVDFSVLHHDPLTRTMEIEWVMAPLSVIEQGRKAAFNLGFFPVAIGVADSKEEGLRYVFSRARQPFNFYIDKPVFACLVALGFFVASVAFILWGDLWNSKISEQSLAKLKAESAAVQTIKADVEKMGAGGARLTALAKGPDIADILRQLTEALPDDSWVFECDVTGSQLRIIGYSTSASSLVEHLASATLFDHPHFQAPITPQANTPNHKPLERFDIVMTVRGRSATKETE